MTTPRDASLTGAAAQPDLTPDDARALPAAALTPEAVERVAAALEARPRGDADHRAHKAAALLRALSAEREATEQAIRKYVCPPVDNECWEEAGPYICLGEDGDPIIDAATHAQVVEQMSACWFKMQQRWETLSAENQRLREALNQCGALFYEIRCDFTDPRSECRDGMEICRKATNP